MIITKYFSRSSVTRGRSTSPSRIPVVPQAENYRRNSRIESPKSSPSKSRSRPKSDARSKKGSQEKLNSRNPNNQTQPKLNSRSFVDSGFNSSYPSKLSLKSFVISKKIKGLQTSYERNFRKP